MTILIYYLIVINIVAWIAYGVDKKRAIRKQYRISERSLLGLSLFGGCIGSLLGMISFHHKIRKSKFWLFNTFICIVYCYLVYLYKIA